MKNPSLKQIVNYTSGFLSLFSFFLLLGVWFFYPNSLNVYIIILFPSALFGVSYFLFSYTLEIFIYRKIKLIYKTIYKYKSHKSREGRKISLKGDVLMGVELEVENWAKTNQQEREQLEKMENFRREFLGNVSHELKTPIFNIQGYIETLIEGGVYDEKINLKYLRSAIKNVERLGVIVSDLELISRVESGTLDLNIEKFVINELIFEILDSLEMRANQANIKLQFKDGRNLSFTVKADKKRISQVLNNLIINSIKYGKSDGKTVITCFDFGDNILVEVTDDGIGIDASHLPRLFERFYRVDSNRSREQGGSGLGLSIVKHIIEAHEQTIHVRSTIDVGSSFGFTLEKA